MMRKVLVAGLTFLVCGLGAIASSVLISDTSMWHDISLIIGGVLVGAATSLFTLYRLAEENPNIIVELEKLDDKERRV